MSWFFLEKKLKKIGAIKYNLLWVTTILRFIKKMRENTFFSGYHLTQTYFPSIVFVIVAWVSFFVPSDVVPGRMVLCVTTLLTLTSMFNSVRWVWYHAENLKKGLIYIENDLLHKYICLQNVDGPNWLRDNIKTPFLLLKCANHQ